MKVVPAKRPSVQVGDPFTEKVLIECTLEVLHGRARRRASRISAAPASPARPRELASNGEGGMHVWLDRVPLRDATLVA